ncbi:MAG: hypothetical protein ACQKBW_10220 [Puniceicoccales bacterium]
MKTHANPSPLFQRLLSGTAVLAALCALSISTAQAEVVAYDSIDYAVGPLDGQNGGSGWYQPWIGKNNKASNTSVSDEAISYSADGITRGGGNTIKIESTVSDKNDGNHNALIRDVYARTSPDVQGGKDYYVSFIAKAVGGPDGKSVGTFFFALQARDVKPVSDQDTVGFLGLAGFAGARVNKQDAFIANSKNNKTSNKWGDTYFIVVKYSGWNATAKCYETATLWRNPTAKPEGQQSSTSSATITVPGKGSDGFRGIQARVYFSQSTSGSYYLLDDFIVSTDWDSAVGTMPGQ